MRPGFIVLTALLVAACGASENAFPLIDDGLPPPPAAAETLLPQIGPLCERAHADPEKWPVAAPPESIPAGSVLVALHRAAAAGSWEAAPGAPAQASAAIADETRVIACVVQINNTVGSYEEVGTGKYAGQAFSTTWNVRLIDWPEGRPIAATSFTSNDPPEIRRAGDSGEAPGPAGELNKWLTQSLDTALLRHDGNVTRIAFSPDGNRLAVGTFAAIDDRDKRGVIVLWDLATRKSIQRVRIPGEYPSALGFTSDGRTMLALGSDGTVQTWDASLGTGLTKHSLPVRVTTAMFLDEGARLLYGSDDTRVHVSEIDSGREIATIPVHALRREVSGISVAGGFVAALETQQPAVAKVWDISTGAVAARFELQRRAQPVSIFSTSGEPSVALSPDGSLLATAGENAMRLWNVREGRLERTLCEEDESGDHPCGTVFRMAFAQDGSRLLAISPRYGLMEWNVATGRPTRARSVVDVDSFMTSPDGRMLLTTSFTNVRLWDAVTWQPVGANR